MEDVYIQKSIKFIILSTLCLIMGVQHNAPVDDMEKPNVLFIAIDDLNDWTGFLDGHMNMDVRTPNIDRLANRSHVFANAHAASPACAPSRLAIMTGVHPVRSEIMRNRGGDGPWWREREALEDVETLEQFFKNRGYKTLGSGKTYHTLEPERTTTSHVEPENWDFYFPSPYVNLPYQIRAPIDEDNIFYEWPEGRAEWHTIGPIPVEDKKMSDYHIVEWASYQLGQKHDQPFFLASGIFRPHSPWEVPQKYFDMYPLEDVEIPENKKDDLKDALDHNRRFAHGWVLENGQWENIVQAYAASISFADAMIGRLLDALERSPHTENTVVALWSDHGVHIGEKENYEKFTLWESATRVPLIINIPEGTGGLPEGTTPGSQYTEPVSLLDLYPTLAEVAGFEIPSHVDGTSLVPQLKGEELQRSPVVTSYNFGDEIGVGHAVRSENYRYIYYPDVGLEELYDHRSDPNEWDNVAYKDENKEVVERHRQVLRKRFPDLELTWKEDAPDGYEVTGDGSVRNIDFTPIGEQ
jgi:arylsulfatase A-like enzyme